MVNDIEKTIGNTIQISKKGNRRIVDLYGLDSCLNNVFCM